MYGLSNQPCDESIRSSLEPKIQFSLEKKKPICCMISILRAFLLKLLGWELSNPK